MTNIQWTDATWNPVTGCRKVSPGCAHCYAETMARRQMGPWKGRAFEDVWTHRDRLVAPLRWRKPRRVFVNSMSDLFHESVPDAFIDSVFAVMAWCRWHTFQVLTKRPERMREYCQRLARMSREDRALQLVDSNRQHLAVAHNGGLDWPLPNVWLGVSCEDQQRADERVPILLDTPAAVRFVSAEPLLGPADFGEWLAPPEPSGTTYGGVQEMIGGASLLDWVIVGGESGPGARPCDVAWVRSVVEQCLVADVPCFVKQVGARPIFRRDDLTDEQFRNLDASEHGWTGGPVRPPMRDRKGGDPAEWPEDLRVREWPASTASGA